MIENYESIIYEDKDVKTNVNVKFTNEAIFFDLDGTSYYLVYEPAGFDRGSHQAG